MKKKEKWIKCKNCGKEFYVPPSRLKTAKYCSKKCYDTSQIGQIPWNKGTGEKRECIVCGKTVYVIPSRKKECRGKYCSVQCYRTEQRKHFKKEFNEKVIIASYLNERKTCAQIAKESGYSKTSIKRVLKKNKIKTRRMDDYDRSKIYQNMKKNVDVNSIIKDYKNGLSSGDLAKKYKCSSTTILKRLKEHSKLRKGDEIYAAFRKSDRYSRWLKINKEKAKIRSSKPEYKLFHTQKILKMYASGKFPRQTHTNIEMLMKKELKRRGYKEGKEFIHQYNLNNKFMCDFVFLKQKVIIECDGDFWHANPKKYAKIPLRQAQKNTLGKDKSKEAYIKKIDQGSWKLLRFWESDIKENVAKCVDKIEKILVNH